MKSCCFLQAVASAENNKRGTGASRQLPASMDCLCYFLMIWSEQHSLPIQQIPSLSSTILSSSWREPSVRTCFLESETATKMNMVIPPVIFGLHSREPHYSQVSAAACGGSTNQEEVRTQSRNISSVFVLHVHTDQVSCSQSGATLRLRRGAERKIPPPEKIPRRAGSKSLGETRGQSPHCGSPNERAPECEGSNLKPKPARKMLLNVFVDEVFIGIQVPSGIVVAGEHVVAPVGKLFFSFLFGHDIL